MNKKVKDRIKKGLSKFKPILQSAVDRDISEADTVHIIHDMLNEIMGWDKYAEITTEYKIRNTYCDLAIKFDGKLKYLIEAKAIGSDLKENHLRQAVSYAATEGTDWVVLTNGRVWQVHQVILDKKVLNKQILSFDLLNLTIQAQDLYDMLFTLCKEAVKKEAIESYAARQSVLNRHILAALMLSKPMVDSLRREIRRLNKDVKASPEEIIEILKADVIKRELLEGERAVKAKSKIKRAVNKRLREVKTKKEASENTADTSTDKLDDTAETASLPRGLSTSPQPIEKEKPWEV